MRIPSPHRFECPFDEVATFAQGPGALRPFQSCADALILIFGRHRHHVRIPENLVTARGCQVVDKTHQLTLYKRTECPASGHAGND